MLRCDEVCCVAGCSVAVRGVRSVMGCVRCAADQAAKAYRYQNTQPIIPSTFWPLAASWAPWDKRSLITSNINLVSSTTLLRSTLAS